MEAKKSPPAAAAAEHYGRKNGAAGVAPPAAGYFSSVFPPPPAANGKDATQTDLYTMLNKQNSKVQNGIAHGGIADGKSQGSPTKGRTAYSKDGKPSYPIESSESPYFGSSVHYGGRDFYGSSPHKQATEFSRNYEEDNQDGSIATRGDWWQGSLYY